jgi:hypothetical protein
MHTLSPDWVVKYGGVGTAGIVIVLSLVLQGVVLTGVVVTLIVLVLTLM